MYVATAPPRGETMQGIETYRIHLDGRWGLNDLYDFPHALAQTYAFAYCFESDLPPRDAERIDEAMRSYPWDGGYSVVNIYVVLQNQVPHEVRPQIQSIQYASPGWLDLLASIDVITKVAAQVAAISTSIAIATKYYSSIQKMLQDIRLQKKRSQLAHFVIDPGLFNADIAAPIAGRRRVKKAVPSATRV